MEIWRGRDDYILAMMENEEVLTVEGIGIGGFVGEGDGEFHGFCFHAEKKGRFK